MCEKVRVRKPLLDYMKHYLCRTMINRNRVTVLVFNIVIRRGGSKIAFATDRPAEEIFTLHSYTYTILLGGLDYKKL